MTYSGNLLIKEGRTILFVLSVIAILGIIFWWPLAILALAAFIFSVYFFRNPKRECKQAEHDHSLLVCPADGRVVAVECDTQSGFEGYAQKISIFLSVTDVHVNRAPMAGTITNVAYHAGSFVPAFLPKSSHLNEHNDIVICDNCGRRIVVRQIAGIIARRICCWVKKGDDVRCGQRYGMIRFGSRVDILLPDSVQVYITKGQRVYGGETLLGRWICTK